MWHVSIFSCNLSRSICAILFLIALFIFMSITHMYSHIYKEMHPCLFIFPSYSWHIVQNSSHYSWHLSLEHFLLNPANSLLNLSPVTYKLFMSNSSQQIPTLRLTLSCEDGNRSSFRNTLSFLSWKRWRESRNLSRSNPNCNRPWAESIRIELVQSACRMWSSCSNVVENSNWFP